MEQAAGDDMTLRYRTIKGLEILPFRGRKDNLRYNHELKSFHSLVLHFCRYWDTFF